MLGTRGVVRHQSASIDADGVSGTVRSPQAGSVSSVRRARAAARRADEASSEADNSGLSSRRDVKAGVPLRRVASQERV